MGASTLQRRIVISAGLLVAAFALIGFRLLDVMVLKGRVTGVTENLVDRPPLLRADLLDRNGQLLARDLPRRRRLCTARSVRQPGRGGA